MEVEEVSSSSISSSSSSSSEEETSPKHQRVINTRQYMCPHSYLGEVDDITCRSTFLGEGAAVTLPLLYLEGIVLFPGATLPLRVLQPRFRAAVELAMHHEEAPCTLGVVHARARGGSVHVSVVGTTAEIRQSRSAPDGSMNIISKGRQRFRTVDVWTNADGVVCGNVHILPEKVALRIPRDAFAVLASVPSFQSGRDPAVTSVEEDIGDGQEAADGIGPKTTVSPSCERYLSTEGVRRDCFHKRWAFDSSKLMYRVQRSAWPHWVYRMFDVYDLARRAADLWTQFVDHPSVYDMIRQPEILSYHIASKIPVKDATRQELLEMDGSLYRLQREIILLESMNDLNCRSCRALIAKRSDMLVMSPEGPMDAFVNSYGFVHETLTLLRTEGLMLQGDPETQDSWFPGYSWTIAHCDGCGSHVGWLYKAVGKGLSPRLFWGLRRSQLAESSA